MLTAVIYGLLDLTTRPCKAYGLVAIRLLLRRRIQFKIQLRSRATTLITLNVDNNAGGLFPMLATIAGKRLMQAESRQRKPQRGECEQRCAHSKFHQKPSVTDLVLIGSNEFFRCFFN